MHVKTLSLMEESVTPAGSTSSMVMSLAVSGPWFVTTSVYVNGAPACTDDGAVFAIERSEEPGPGGVMPTATVSVDEQPLPMTTMPSVVVPLLPVWNVMTFVP